MGRLLECAWDRQPHQLQDVAALLAPPPDLLFHTNRILFRPLFSYVSKWCISSLSYAQLDRSLSRAFRLPKTMYRGHLETRRQALVAAAAPLTGGESPLGSAVDGELEPSPNLRLPGKEESMVRELKGDLNSRSLTVLPAPKVELVGKPIAGMRVSTSAPKELSVTANGVAIWCAGRSLDIEVAGCRPVHVTLPFFFNSACARARVLDDHIVVELPYEPISKIIAAQS